MLEATFLLAMTSLSHRLVESLGTEAVASLADGGNYSVDGLKPEVVVMPSTVEDLSRALSLATREGKVVTPWGGGTQMALGNTPQKIDLIVGLERLNHVHFHEPADMVARVEAGITLKSLQDELAREGQFLPLEAPLASRATIGGILAANSSGPSRFAYGTARDWLIGISVANPDGTITRSGGRVVKNVSGYDLNKLYIGSLGTLGIIVEATFKLAPLPQEKCTVVATYPSLSDAVDSAREVLHQKFVPHALLVVNREIAGRLPLLALKPSDGAAVVALLAGRKSAVQRKVDGSARLMEKGDAQRVESLDQGQGEDMWQAITDLGWSEDGPPHLSARVSLLPTQVKDFLALADSSGDASLKYGVVADVGWGLVRLMWWPGEGTPFAAGLATNIIKRLRNAARHHDGHVVVERCPIEVKANIDVWGDSSDGMAIMRRIKQELDPTGTLNPGRFVSRI